jgi:ankyrin repeat protein
MGKVIQIKSPNLFNVTELDRAVINGNLEIVKALVDEQTNINEPNKYDDTLLYLAAYEGHLDIVKFFVEKKINNDEPNKKANINKPNKAGDNPLSNL